MAPETAAAGVKERTTRRAPSSSSGRLLLRMPPELHTELARAAERAGTSLNGLITTELERAVGWRENQSEELLRSRRRLAFLLVANAAAVGLAALAALGLLLTAWLG